MKPVVIASNMYNEINQVSEWYENVSNVADGGILIVDSGSNDGTIEFFMEKKNVVLIIDAIIQIEGYGPARNHLRAKAREHYPNAHWLCYLDADERISSEEFHKFRWIKDYLIFDYDVIALPRIDWLDKEKSGMAKDYHTQPDFQARMTRLASPLRYVRKLHEQLVDYTGIYANVSSPKINHFHRSAGQEKRDFIGKICAKLHDEDEEYGATYPKHHKEDYYHAKYLKEGLKK